MHSLIAVAVLVFLAPTAPVAEPVNNPNVLFIDVDDLNHWVGHLVRNPQTTIIRRSETCEHFVSWPCCS
jgi:hypothetical protein